MATTTGLVQRVSISKGDASQVSACALVGPTPDNVAALFLRRQATDPAHTGAFITSMLDGLSQALSSRREVVVTHEDTGGEITAVDLR